MGQHKLAKLIQYIARQVGTEDDITFVIESLIDVDDWQKEIELEDRYFANRERSRIYQANRRARDKDLPGTLALSQWFETLSRFNGRCAYCLQPFSYEHLEHLIPLNLRIKGTTADNCVPSCRDCNKRKGVKGAEYWYAQLMQRTLPIEDLPDDPFARNYFSAWEYLKTRRQPQVRKYTITDYRSSLMRVSTE